MKKKQVHECWNCGSKRFVIGTTLQGGIVKLQKGIVGQPIKFIICKECGCIVYSYVDKPENLDDYFPEN